MQLFLSTTYNASRENSSLVYELLHRCITKWQVVLIIGNECRIRISYYQWAFVENSTYDLS